MNNNNNNEIKLTDKDIECIGEKISETIIEITKYYKKGKFHEKKNT